MRNPTFPERPFEQWPAKREPDSIALTLQDSGALRRPPSPPRIDEQRVAELAHEILAVAIRLAAMLEVAQQVAAAQRRDTVDMAAVGGSGNA